MEDFVVIPIDDDYLPIIIPAEPVALPTTEVNVPGLQGPSGTINQAYQTLDADFNSQDGAKLLGSLPVKAVIKEVQVKVTIPFNDPAAYMLIGIDGFENKYFTAHDSQLTVEAEFSSSEDFELSSAEEIKLFLSTMATVGAGKVSITYYIKE